MIAYPLPGFALLVLILGLLGPSGVTAPPPGLLAAGGSLLLMASGLSLVRSGRLAALRGYSLVALVGLLVWCLLGCLHSLDPFLSGLGLSEWIAATGFFAAVLVGVESKDGWIFLASGVVGITCVSCIYGVGRMAADGGVLRANFTNPDCYSLLPMIGLLLALGLVDRAEGLRKFSMIAAVPFLTLCLVLTASRAGLLGALVGGTTFLWLARGRDAARGAIALSLAAPVLAMFLLLALGRTDLVTGKWNELIRAHGGDVGTRARLDAVVYGVKTVAHRPILGSGSNTFQLAFQEFRPPTLGEAYLNVANNDYIQLAVELGLVGAGLWFGLSIFAIYRGMVNGQLGGIHYQGAGCAILGVLVYALGNFAEPVLTDLIYWMLIVALAITFRPNPVWPRNASRVLGLGLVLLGLVGCWLGLQVAWNNRCLAAAQLETDNLDWGAAQQRLSRHLDLNDARVRLARSRNAFRLFTFTSEAEQLLAAQDELQKLLVVSPHNLEAMLAVSNLADSQEKYGESLEWLEKARRESMFFPGYARLLARNYLLQGRFEEAAEALRQVGGDETAALGDLLVIIDQTHPGRAIQALASWYGGDPALADRVALTAGDRAQSLGNRGLAVQFYRFLVSKRPAEPGVNYKLAVLESDPARQLRLVTRELHLKDETPAVLSQSLLLWIRLKGDRDAATRKTAILELEKFIQKNPRFNEARLRLAELYDKQERNADARRILREGIDFDRTGMLHYALGVLYEHQGDPEIALSYFEDAVKNSPDNATYKAAVERIQNNPAASVVPADQLPKKRGASLELLQQQ